MGNASSSSDQNQPSQNVLYSEHVQKLARLQRFEHVDPLFLTEPLTNFISDLVFDPLGFMSDRHVNEEIAVRSIDEIPIKVGQTYRYYDTFKKFTRIKILAIEYPLAYPDDKNRAVVSYSHYPDPGDSAVITDMYARMCCTIFADEEPSADKLAPQTKDENDDEDDDEELRETKTKDYWKGLSNTGNEDTLTEVVIELFGVPATPEQIEQAKKEIKEGFGLDDSQ
jgi:hypothetical protein